MALIVQKYGGTSVGSVERIQNVAKRVKLWTDAGHSVVVVVSAMSGETNRLTALAQSIHSNPSRRELDVILSSGEQVTSGLLCLALQALRQKAVSFVGWQAGIHTDGHHNKARISHILPERIFAALDEQCVVVITGFQGISPASNIATLGRGGSDVSAVAIATALKADECQIYTDVDGVYTTDPRVEPNARAMATLTFEEMIELASLGAKVLQLRSVEFAYKHNMPIRVLSSLKEMDIKNLGGTLIQSDENEEDKIMEKPLISGIAFQRDEAKISILGVPDRPGIASDILGPIAEANIEIDMIIQNLSTDNQRTDFTFTVERANYKEAMSIMNLKAKQVGATSVNGSDNIAKLSLVGVGMRSHSGVACKMFEVLAKNDINIQLISTSEIKISVIIDEIYIDDAVRELHSAFELDKTP